MSQDLQKLTVEDVLRIHEVLVRDFAEDGDPISPAGLRSIDLLASAVSRQQTGLGNILKYAEPIPNAATLAYGICNNHPFHNGNKRTALVAMLAHLDRNNLCLDGARQKDLYGLIIDVASHSIVANGGRKGASKRQMAPADSDAEVAALARWLSRRVRKVTVGERQITFRQLRRLLGRHGYGLEHPKGNSIDVVRYETERRGIFRKREVQVQKRIHNIGYPGDTRFVPVGTLKGVRRLCHLTEQEGVDSRAFYDDEAVVDAFVNRYRTILRRLARR